MSKLTSVWRCSNDNVVHISVVAFWHRNCVRTFFLWVGCSENESHKPEFKLILCNDGMEKWKQNGIKFFSEELLKRNIRLFFHNAPWFYQRLVLFNIISNIISKTCVFQTLLGRLLDFIKDLRFFLTQAKQLTVERNHDARIRTQSINEPIYDVWRRKQRLFDRCWMRKSFWIICTRSVAPTLKTKKTKRRKCRTFDKRGRPLIFIWRFFISLCF